MSRYLTLAQAKSYSNIYFSDKDADLQLLLDAAEAFVANFLNRPLSDLVEELDSPAGTEGLKPDVQVLVLGAFDDLWQNKGTQVVGTIISDNPTWMRALHLYRIDLGV